MDLITIIRLLITNMTDFLFENDDDKKVLFLVKYINNIGYDNFKNINYIKCQNIYGKDFNILKNKKFKIVKDLVKIFNNIKPNNIHYINFQIIEFLYYSGINFKKYIETRKIIENNDIERYFVSLIKHIKESKLENTFQLKKKYKYFPIKYRKIIDKIIKNHGYSDLSLEYSEHELVKMFVDKINVDQITECFGDYDIKKLEKIYIKSKLISGR